MGIKDCNSDDQNLQFDGYNEACNILQGGHITEQLTTALSSSTTF